jgi:hypothetical protein
VDRIIAAMEKAVPQMFGADTIARFAVGEQSGVSLLVHR